MIQYLQDNWATIITIIVALLPALELIVRLTPTKKDDTALDWFKKLFDAIVPNRKAGGGNHQA
ncbi:MAG TPA: hypothetical protein PKC39_14565 [Ferruginibacter sp.]|nr:hypothetical protein [Ferruginibacter sp.]HMP22179.1 hypothetical protein [Ferruginibacter sp.]